MVTQQVEYMLDYVEQRKILVGYIHQIPLNAADILKNAFKAAPLQVTQTSLNVSKQLSAVVINSAIANACTGERGLRDAIQTKNGFPENFNFQNMK